MLRANTSTVRSLLADARRRVEAVDARVLMCAALARDAAYLIAHGEDPVSWEQALTYNAWIARRAAGEPVAYIVGHREFYGRRFRLTRDVLIPRPETELLVDVALQTLRGMTTPGILDLGTGSGCIALTMAAECAGAHVTGVDVSADALAVARTNAIDLHLPQVEWHMSDWLRDIGDRRYELIVSNPPYIAGDDAHLSQGDLRFEPRASLTPEGDGLAAIRRIVRDSVHHLVAGGWLWFEHGHDQGEACRALLAEWGYDAIATHRDIAGHERVTGGKRP